MSLNKYKIMTARSFWIILVRLMGLLIIINSIVQIPLILINFSGAGEDGMAIIGFYLLALIVVLYLAYHFLIKHTSIIVKLLGLDKDMEDDIFQLQLQSTSVLQLAIILLGGYLLIANVPILIEQIVKMLKISLYEFDMETETTLIWPIYNLCMSIVGYIFIRYFKSIAAKVQSHIDNETNS